jgi:hypothetical protein
MYNADTTELHSLNGNVIYTAPLPKHEIALEGKENLVLEYAQLFYKKGWDVIIKRGKHSYMLARIPADLFDDGITPRNSPCNMLPMGSYKEI